MDDLITEMQKGVFERQGVNGSWGIVCLGRINTEHKDDANFIAVFYQFIMLCARVFSLVGINVSVMADTDVIASSHRRLACLLLAHFAHTKILSAGFQRCCDASLSGLTCTVYLSEPMIDTRVN